MILQSTRTIIRVKDPRKCASGVEPNTILRSNAQRYDAIIAKVGHMVANCSRKKIDYIFQRTKEDLQRKVDIREERKNLQKSKERNRILEINIIKKRAQYFEGFL